MVGVELDHARARMLGDHPALQCRRYRVVLLGQDVGARDRREHGVVDADRRVEHGDRLRAPMGDGLRDLLGRAAVVDRGGGGLVREPGHRGVAFDDDVGLDHVVGPLGQMCQIEKALPVRGHEGAHEDQRRDAFGPVPGGLRDHGTAHAVPDEHRGLGARREHRADALCAALERDPLERRLGPRRRRGGRASRRCDRPPPGHP